MQTTPSGSAQRLRAFANQGFPVTLPLSQVEVLCKKIGLTDLVRRKIIPASLLQKALSGFPELEKPEKVDPEKMIDLVDEADEYTFSVIQAVLVSPRLVKENPGEDEITMDDLLEEDRVALTLLAQLPVKQWESFLRDEAKRLSTMGYFEESEPETE